LRVLARHILSQMTGTLPTRPVGAYYLQFPSLLSAPYRRDSRPDYSARPVTPEIERWRSSVLTMKAFCSMRRALMAQQARFRPERPADCPTSNTRRCGTVYTTHSISAAYFSYHAFAKASGSKNSRTSSCTVFSRLLLYPWTVFDVVITDLLRAIHMGITE
jgi:hypothetical protein